MPDAKAQVLAAILFLLIGIVGGCKATSMLLLPRIAALKTQLQAESERAKGMERSFQALSDAASEQDKALQDLQALQALREQQAKSAIAAAHAGAAKKQAAAAQIMLSKPAPGEDECAAASNAFDAELRLERGG
ncbi:MAG: hypothetical protein JNM98_18590 [Rhodocyclaceae bacterium]|nr:hypothetical protein [Rhodocyclaceae bacterium]